MRNIVMMLMAFGWAGVAHADDIMMTGPKAEQVKKEIVDLLMKDDLQAFDKGGAAAADYIDRHDVDSILYLGGINENVTKAQRVKEWRGSERRIIDHRRYDVRVRVYDNGNVAVVDFMNDLTAHYGGKDSKPNTSHILRVYVKDKGIWRTIVFDQFPGRSSGGK